MEATSVELAHIGAMGFLEGCIASTVTTIDAERWVKLLSEQGYGDTEAGAIAQRILDCRRSLDDPPGEEWLSYNDLRAGDVVVVTIDSPLFPQVHGNKERREIVAVDDGGPETAQGRVVRFRDPDDGREYDIDVQKARDPRRRFRLLERGAH
jgi:hypothetical protein